jgi:hypothetical protein
MPNLEVRLIDTVGDNNREWYVPRHRSLSLLTSSLCSKGHGPASRRITLFSSLSSSSQPSSSSSSSIGAHQAPAPDTPRAARAKRRLTISEWSRPTLTSPNVPSPRAARAQPKRSRPASPSGLQSLFDLFSSDDDAKVKPTPKKNPPSRRTSRSADPGLAVLDNVEKVSTTSQAEIQVESVQSENVEYPSSGLKAGARFSTTQVGPSSAFVDRVNKVTKEGTVSEGNSRLTSSTSHPPHPSIIESKSIRADPPISLGETTTTKRVSRLKSPTTNVRDSTAHRQATTPPTTPTTRALADYIRTELAAQHAVRDVQSHQIGPPLLHSNPLQTEHGLESLQRLEIATPLTTSVMPQRSRSSSSDLFGSDDDSSYYDSSLYGQSPPPAAFQAITTSTSLYARSEGDVHPDSLDDEDMELYLYGEKYAEGKEEATEGQAMDICSEDEDWRKGWALELSK